jgi:hypothetical protein
LPPGSSFPDESVNSVALSKSRDIELVFVGSKAGVPSIRYFGRFLIYTNAGVSFCDRTKHSWFDRLRVWLEKGTLPDEELATLYARARLGLNKHNSPVNFRHDLAAFSVLQICDNKAHVGKVFS